MNKIKTNGLINFLNTNDSVLVAPATPKAEPRNNSNDMWKQIELTVVNNLDSFEDSRKFCAYCGNNSDIETLGRCYGCQMVYYCSQEHQLNDWLEHMQKCSELEWVSLCELIQCIPAPPPVCDIGQYWPKSVHEITTWTEWFDIRPNLINVARNTAKIFDHIKINLKKREPSFDDLIDGLLAAITESMTYSLTIGNALVKIGVNPCVKPICIHCLQPPNDVFDFKSNQEFIKRQFYELCNMFPGCKGFEIVFIGTNINSETVYEPYMKNDKKFLPHNQLLYISTWHGTYNNYIKYYCQIENYSLPDLVIAFQPNFTSSPHKLIHDWTDDLKQILTNNFTCLFTFYDSNEKVKAFNLLSAFQTNILFMQTNQFSSLLMRQMLNKPNNVYAANSYFMLIRGFNQEKLQQDDRYVSNRLFLSQNNKQHNACVQTVGLSQPENCSLRHINGKLQVIANKNVYDGDDAIQIESQGQEDVTPPLLDFNKKPEQPDKVSFRPRNFHRNGNEKLNGKQINDINLLKYLNSGYATPSSETSGSYYQPKLNLTQNNTISTVNNTFSMHQRGFAKKSSDSDNDEVFMQQQQQPVKMTMVSSNKSNQKHVQSKKQKRMNNMRSNIEENNEEVDEDEDEDREYYEYDGGSGLPAPKPRIYVTMKSFDFDNIHESIPYAKPRKPKPKPRQSNSEEFYDSSSKSGEFNVNEPSQAVSVKPLNSPPTQLKKEPERVVKAEREVQKVISTTKEYLEKGIQIRTFSISDKTATETKSAFSAKIQDNKKTPEKLNNPAIPVTKTTDNEQAEDCVSNVASNPSGFVNQMKNMFEQQMNPYGKKGSTAQSPSKSQIQNLTAKLASSGNVPLFRGSESDTAAAAAPQQPQPKRINENRPETDIQKIIRTIKIPGHGDHMTPVNVEYTNDDNADSSFRPTINQANSAAPSTTCSHIYDTTSISSEFRILNMKDVDKRPKTPSAKSLTSLTNTNGVFIQHLPDPIDVVKLEFEGERHVLVPGYMTSADILRNMLIKERKGSTSSEESGVSLKEKLRMQMQTESRVAATAAAPSPPKPTVIKNQNQFNDPYSDYSYIDTTAVAVAIPKSVNTNANTVNNKAQKSNESASIPPTPPLPSTFNTPSVTVPSPPPAPPLPSFNDIPKQQKIVKPKPPASLPLEASNSNSNTKKPVIEHDDDDLFFLKKKPTANSKKSTGVLKLDSEDSCKKTTTKGRINLDCLDMDSTYGAKSSSSYKASINYDVLDLFPDTKITTEKRPEVAHKKFNINDVENLDFNNPPSVTSTSEPIKIVEKKESQKILPPQRQQNNYVFQKDTVKSDSRVASPEVRLVQRSEPEVIVFEDRRWIDRQSDREVVLEERPVEVAPSKRKNSYSTEQVRLDVESNLPKISLDTISTYDKLLIETAATSPTTPNVLPRSNTFNSSSNPTRPNHIDIVPTRPAPSRPAIRQTLNEHSSNVNTDSEGGCSSGAPLKTRKESVTGNFDANDFDSFDEADSSFNPNKTDSYQLRINVNTHEHNTTSPTSPVLTTFMSPKKEFKPLEKPTYVQSTATLESETKLSRFDANDFDSFDEDDSPQVQQPQYQSSPKSSNIVEISNGDGNAKGGFFRSALSRISGRNDKSFKKRSSSMPPSKLLEDMNGEPDRSKPSDASTVNNGNAKTLKIMNKMQSEYEEKQKRRQLRLSMQQKSTTDLVTTPQTPQQTQQQQQQQTKASNDRSFFNSFMSSLFNKSNDQTSSPCEETGQNQNLQKNEAKRLSLRKLKAKDKAKKNSDQVASSVNGDAYQSDSDVDPRRFSSYSENNDSSSYTRSTSFDSSLIKPKRFGQIKNESQNGSLCDITNKENLMQQIRADLDEEIKSRYAVENANLKTHSCQQLNEPPSSQRQPRQQQKQQHQQQTQHHSNGSKMRSKSVTFLDAISTDDELLSSNTETVSNRTSYYENRNTTQQQQQQQNVQQAPMTPTTSSRKSLKTGDVRLMCGALTGAGPIRSIIKKSATDLSITLNAQLHDTFVTLPQLESNTIRNELMSNANDDSDENSRSHKRQSDL